jgi:hypothetical protein
MTSGGGGGAAVFFSHIIPLCLQVFTLMNLLILLTRWKNPKN